MDPINVLKVFVRLEKDIAAFYSKLKNISIIREVVNTYEKMEQQSESHAKKIMNDYNAFRIPDLDIEPLMVLHNHVKQNLLEEIKNESNVVYILQKLADAEEKLGKIYKSIAIHYKRNGEKYLNLSSAIDTIGDEEYMHRDVILKDMQRQIEKQKTEPTASNTGRSLSIQEYKKIQSALTQLKTKLDDLKLLKNDKVIIDKELEIADQTLVKSGEKITKCVSKCHEVLQYQKSNKQIDELLKQFGDINL
jgi:hypothetical protein